MVDRWDALEVASKLRPARFSFPHPSSGKRWHLSRPQSCAWRHASGEFIAILDSDDIWLPTFLERQLPLFERHDVDIVTGNAWFLGSRLDGQCARPARIPGPTRSAGDPAGRTCGVHPVGVHVARVYERIGGFDEALRTNEDYDYWIRAALAGFRFWRNDVPLGRYRRRDDSLSASEVRMLRGSCGSLQDPSGPAAIDLRTQRFSTHRSPGSTRNAWPRRRARRWKPVMLLPPAITWPPPRRPRRRHAGARLLHGALDPGTPVAWLTTCAVPA